MAEVNELNFKRSFWGYKPAYVQREIERIHHSFAERQQQQKAKLANAEEELTAQRKKLEYTNQQINEFKMQERTVIDSLTKVQSSAATIEEKAWQESRNIVNNALKEVEAQKYSLELLSQQYDAFRSDFTSVLHRYSASLIDADTEKPKGKTKNDAFELLLNEEFRIS